MEKLVLLPLNLCGFLLGLFGTHGFSAIRVFKVFKIVNQLVIICCEVVFPELSQDGLELAP